MSPKPIHAALEAVRAAERSSNLKTSTSRLAEAVRVLVDEIRDLQEQVEELRLREETRDRGPPKGAS